MSTTNTLGTVSANATAPTIITLTPLARVVSLVVSDGGAGGYTRYAVNGETVNQTTNSAMPASGIMFPIIHQTGLGTLTLYSVGGATDQTYCLASLSRFN